MHRFLLRLARTPLGGRLAGWALHRFGRLLPLRRLPAPPGWIAFHHPAPSYPVHVLLVPVPPVPGLDALAGPDARRLAAVLSIGRSIAVQLDLPPGWQLVLNGGAFQDVRLLHFHLVSRNSNRKPGPGGAGARFPV